MRFFRVVAVPLVLISLGLAGCGGGGGGGNTAAPAPDTLAPTVSISAPAAAANVSGVTSVTASAQDNVGVSKVEFYLNGVLLGTDTSAPYAYSWDTTALLRGTYHWSAKAYDAANNVGTSADVAVVLPPITVSMTTDLNTATGTVFLAGLSSPDVFAMTLNFTMPPGASVTSATPSGVAAGALSSSPGPNVTLASSSGFGAGEVMQVHFAGIPQGATPASFGVSVSAVFGFGGVVIQP